MPLYSIERVDGDGFLALWEITETLDELIGLSIIPDDEMENILRYSSRQRQIEQLAVRLLLNKCFTKKQYLGYEENNRPYLKNYPGDISISHTNRFVGIVVHGNKYVGIDIEGRSRNFFPVENRVITDYEQSYLSDRYRDDQLCVIWCAKEAIYKAMHEQKVEFNRQMEIKRFIPRREGRLEARFIDNQYEDQNLKLFYRMLNDDYAMAWVLRD
ncbi:MAG: 4'-phosphopantetheinyl transferase superfamily protein [Prevotellaceae bacterium]|jgi:phosphopantetheinyl transferase (holo-ACP synthase)|nr:4'-phosphopantetheinyl transferase superfamily protein [Prevotellaceae bacterium]